MQWSVTGAITRGHGARTSDLGNDPRSRGRRGRRAVPNGSAELYANHADASGICAATGRGAIRE